MCVLLWDTSKVFLQDYKCLVGSFLNLKEAHGIDIKNRFLEGSRFLFKD